MKRMMVSLLAALVFTSGCAVGDTVGNNLDDEAEAAQNRKNTGEAISPPEEKQSVKSSEEQAADEEPSDGEEQDFKREESDIVPDYELKAANWTLEPINDANGKVALITIDDAPDKYALEMAETLKKLEAPAIFFVNGHFIDTDEEKERLKQIHEMGFPIGNHTYSHGRLDKLAVEKQTEEIVKLNDEIEAVTGERPKFFRAPFGINTDHSKKVVKEEGMLLMNWTYGYDWDKNYTTKEALTDIMVNSPYLTDGANLLMHDREWTNAAMEGIVAGLRGKGYEMLDPARIKVTD